MAALGKGDYFRGGNCLSENKKNAERGAQNFQVPEEGRGG